jgi:hypothetical protein
MRVASNLDPARRVNNPFLELPVKQKRPSPPGLYFLAWSAATEIIYTVKNPHKPPRMCGTVWRPVWGVKLLPGTERQNGRSRIVVSFLVTLAFGSGRTRATQKGTGASAGFMAKLRKYPKAGSGFRTGRKSSFQATQEAGLALGRIGERQTGTRSKLVQEGSPGAWCVAGGLTADLDSTPPGDYPFLP